MLTRPIPLPICSNVRAILHAKRPEPERQRRLHSHTPNRMITNSRRSAHKYTYTLNREPEAHAAIRASPNVAGVQNTPRRPNSQPYYQDITCIRAFLTVNGDRDSVWNLWKLVNHSEARFSEVGKWFSGRKRQQETF
jgi:hypothetical protein